MPKSAKNLKNVTIPSTEITHSVQILENVDQIVIKQHLSVVEAVTGFDRVNRYNVWDGKTGSQIFTAREGEIGCCTRNFFQVFIHFTKNTKNPIILF